MAHHLWSISFWTSLCGMSQLEHAEILYFIE